MRKQVFLAALMALGIGATARADTLYTELATITNTAFGQANQNNIGRYAVQGGVSYTNTIAQSVPGTVSVNDTFIAVGAVPVTSYIDNAGNTVPIAAGNTQIFTFVVQGHVTAATPGGGLTTVHFDQSVFALTPPTVPGAFNTGLPLSWGSLGPKAGVWYGLGDNNVVKGNLNAAPDLFAASQTNLIALNLVTATLAQGNILFKDAVPDVDNVKTTTTDPFPPGTAIKFEGLVGVFNEQIADPASAVNNIDAADLAQLNLIVQSYAALGNANGQSFSAFATATGFATGLGAGPVTNYNPGAAIGGGAGTGDFPSNLSGNVDFFITPLQTPGESIPEIDPSSIAGALTLLGGGLLYLTDRRRRRNAK